uniref:Uncharacterized protein n=1 Tax=candidate division WOR-3 bacterium TaxID=2052148 RepID=A0A7C4GEV6_UNCW3
MVKRLLCLVTFPVMVWAAALEVKGRVTEFWESNSFTLTVNGELTKLWFDIPTRSQVKLEVEHGGKQVLMTRLTSRGPIDLNGVGEFTVTVAHDSVDTDWSCRVTSSEEPVLKKVKGFADTLFAFRFTFATEKDPAKWRFQYPREATFIVKQTAPGMSGVEFNDLDDSPIVTCVGGGRFTFEVAPTDGGGQFVAQPVE